MGQEFIYAGRSHTIQLNYLDTAASRAIFSSSHHHGGAAYGGARGVKVGRGDGVLFLGKNWLHCVGGIIMSKSGERVDKSVLDDQDYDRAHIYRM